MKETQKNILVVEDDAGQRTSSGVYFCRLKTSRGTSSRKMILLE